MTTAALLLPSLLLLHSTIASDPESATAAPDSSRPHVLHLSNYWRRGTTSSPPVSLCQNEDEEAFIKKSLRTQGSLDANFVAVSQPDSLSQPVSSPNSILPGEDYNCVAEECVEVTREIKRAFRKHNNLREPVSPIAPIRPPSFMHFSDWDFWEREVKRAQLAGIPIVTVNEARSQRKEHRRRADVQREALKEAEKFLRKPKRDFSEPSAPSFRDPFPGRTLLHTPCSPKGEPMEEGEDARWRNLCGSCGATRELPHEYFPRFLRESLCYGPTCLLHRTHNSTWSSLGYCQQQFIQQRVLRNLGTLNCPRWREETLSLRSGCLCRLKMNESEVSTFNYLTWRVPAPFLLDYRTRGHRGALPTPPPLPGRT